MQDFSVEEVLQMLRGSDFWRVEKSLLFGKALNFGVIFQKIRIKINKTLKNIEKNSRKNAKWLEIFLIFRQQII